MHATRADCPAVGTNAQRPYPRLICGHSISVEP